MPALTPPPESCTPRELFVPPDWRGDQALAVWDQIRHGGGFVPTTERRIQRLVRQHWSGPRVSEVGYLENDGERDWLTIGIYEPVAADDPYLVAILRFADGAVVQRNPPVLVRRGDVLEVIDFQEPSARAEP